MSQRPDLTFRAEAATAVEAETDRARISAEIVGLDPGTDPFVAAVRATRMPMIVTDPRQQDNPVVFVNNAFCRLTGYERNEILGRNCRFLQGPETDPASVAEIRAAVGARRSIEIDIRNYRKDGEPFWNRLLLAPVNDSAGAIAYFFASQVDVTIERERLAGLESANSALLAELSDRLRLQEESEARMRFATAAGRLGIWELNLQTYDLITSALCKASFGFEPNSPFTYADLRAAVHPDDKARMAAAVDDSVATGADYAIDYRTVLPDGSIRWVEVRAQVVSTASGVPPRMVGVTRDVTDRKAQDLRTRTLSEIDRHYRDLTDPAALAFAGAAILGEALEVSRIGYGLIDMAAESITIGRDWNAPGVKSIAGVLHFRDYGSYIEDLKRGETAVVVDAERDPRTRHNAKALEAISARAFVNMPQSEHGEFVALIFANHATARVWSASDLALIREVGDRVRAATERARARLAQQESEQQFLVFAQTVPNQIWAARPDGYLDWFNDQVYGYCGAAHGSLDGTTAWAAIVHADDLTAARETWSRSLATGEVYETEYRLRRRDGAYRWFPSRAAPVRSPGGSIVRWVGTNTDIDDRRRQAAEVAHLNATLEEQVTERTRDLMAVEEALRQSQKMEAVGQLTGGLAHDFNNLLTGIAGSLELLESRIAQGRFADVQRYITAAQGAAKRAAALTHRLLAFSRRQTLDPKPTDVNRLVAGMEDLVRRTVGPAIEVEVVAAVGLWTVLVDPNQLENALLNLCINARDAMPNGGRLTVETANRWLDHHASRDRDVASGQFVSLSVSDTGTGMTPEVIAKAFDPFFTTKPIGEGTGLGLSMIYGFARQSGGQARIYSEVGRGAMVCLYLPRHRGEAESPDMDLREADAKKAGAGETVMVVDDEPTIRMLVIDVLDELGYAAIEAADGNAGLKILQSDTRVDLLITDVGLPGGMNGRQMADAARVVRPDLKVLFITGYAENAAVGNGYLEAGMHVMTKPFAMEGLATRIRDLIIGP